MYLARTFGQMFQKRMGLPEDNENSATAVEQQLCGDPERKDVRLDNSKQDNSDCGQYLNRQQAPNARLCGTEQKRLGEWIGARQQNRDKLPPKGSFALMDNQEGV